GVSMVATTFAADTPNFVAQIVREDGISSNWMWWAFLITGMLTVFIYARLWRKLGITTDLEYYEIRYSGKAAAFLRGFRAIYLGVFFNVVIMATVCLAGVKIGGIMLDLSHWEVLGITCTVTVIYSMLGGLKGVLITDFFQFFVAMLGSILAAWFILDLPEIGGLENLVSHENVQDKLAFIPDKGTDYNLWLGIFIIPLAVQWWAAWYPGAEPGGGGYIAQRMLAAKDEKSATKATLFFNFAHYALRPWPWIIIALASLVIFPTVADLEAAFPNIDKAFVGEDLGYPAMLTYLPAGLLGLVMASLISAFMSTISTHLNWGSSYVVHDFYKRFIRKEAKEKELVLVARMSTLGMMILAALLTLVLQNAADAFKLLVSIGAGSGLLFILRWFWRAINPISEIVAMLVSLIVTVTFFVMDKLAASNDTVIDLKGTMFEGTLDWDSVKLLSVVVITTICWVAATLITRNDKYLNPEFEDRAFEGGENKFKNFGYKLVCILLGCVAIWSALFGMGYWLFDPGVQTVYFFIAFAVSSSMIVVFWKKIFE
ncbi:Na+:solute symporter, partial [Crocinitomix catalasitica]|nr:Na+:solute symporter [Crocinitomix catalasitica]